MSKDYKYIASFRFHGVLNDFLPPERRHRVTRYPFDGHPGIKDPIEALGVPHSEVARILVDGRAVDFSYRLQDNNQVEAYSLGPTGFDLTNPALRPPLAKPSRFVVDVNLGKLARWLRLLGFDTAWRNDYSDRQVVEKAVAEQRVILTRDRRLLFHRIIDYGFWVRAVEPLLQTREVLDRMALWHEIHPFRYCLECNGLIKPVSKKAVLKQLEPLTRRYYDEFYRCSCCHRIYWKGSHYAKLLQKLGDLEGGVN